MISPLSFADSGSVKECLREAIKEMEVEVCSFITFHL